ncbi:MAG: hypothetical protein LBD49_01350 [Oscillospiraceae bacterium]|jgi:hypothetical protein|nr:hypothetical protein [Oscillospiraceae bacterium]
MAVSALRKESYIYAGAAAEEVVPAVRPAAIPREAAGPRVSPFSVIGGAFIAFLAAACLFSRIELMDISADITGVRSGVRRIRSRAGIAEKLDARRAENSALRVEYERAFDLKEIERYAVEELGMARAQNAALRGAETAPEDKAVIPASAKAAEGAGGFMAWILEYFK